LETPRAAATQIAAAEVLPDPVPDLYIGEPVVVAFRAATLPAHAVLRGRFGATTWEREVSLQREFDGVPREVLGDREAIPFPTACCKFVCGVQKAAA